MKNLPTNNFGEFYNRALRFLSFRPRSEKEIRDKLRSKKGPLDIIEKVISKLKEKNFINDEEFVRWWIESKTRFKPRSLRLIKIELRQKGINDELIDAMITDLRLMNNDLEQAKKLAEKRIKRFRSLTKQEIYQKLGRFLASKGFDWDTIKQAIDETLDKGV